ncbi:MAG: hypothetical protein WCW66_04495 [Patescibacteria group bacterium]
MLLHIYQIIMTVVVMAVYLLAYDKMIATAGPLGPLTECGFAVAVACAVLTASAAGATAHVVYGRGIWMGIILFVIAVAGAFGTAFMTIAAMVVAPPLVPAIMIVSSAIVVSLVVWSLADIGSKITHSRDETPRKILSAILQTIVISAFVLTLRLWW